MISRYAADHSDVGRAGTEMGGTPLGNTDAALKLLQSFCLGQINGHSFSKMLTGPWQTTWSAVSKKATPISLD